MTLLTSTKKTQIKQILLPILCCFALQGFSQSTAPTWRTMGGNKDATFYEVRQDFYDYWRDRTPTKGQGYSVFKRWEAYMLPRVYPSGDMTIPSTTYENYMAWLKDGGDSSAEQRSVASDWTSLGPDVVPTGYDSGVGRVDFVRFDPTNSNTMYIGSPDGGLWKSTNGGTSWTTDTDFLGVIGCADLAISKYNTDSMYLATGNWEFDRSSIGVLRSANGGTSWEETDLKWNPSESFKIRRMIMDPVDSKVMMAVTDGGLYRTTDGWVTHTSPLGFNYNLFDIQFKPGDRMTVYASGKDAGSTDVFWKSTDNGVNWTATTTGLPSSADISRILIGVTAHDASYVYLLAGNAAHAYKGLYLSVNSGATFSTQSTTPNILSSDPVPPMTGGGGQAFHDLAIAVSPTDKTKVTIGGINSWRSTNSGVGWSLFTYWLGIDGDDGFLVPYTHADIQSINYLPGSSTTLFFTADGGIYKTVDDGASFTDLSNTLSIGQQYSVAHSATTEGLLFTGLQDIGSIMKSGGSWTLSSGGGGDGAAAFIDRTSDLVIVASSQGGAHQVSADGGATFVSMLGGGLPGGTFYSHILQDPVTATTMYAGGRPAFYKNVDFVNNPTTWVTLGTPPGTGAIIRFIVAPSHPDSIFVIKGDGENATTLSLSTDGGASFTSITGLPTTAQMSNLVVSNVDAKKVWVTYSGYVDGTKVYRSSDGGATWVNMSDGLPNIPMNTIIHVNGSINDELYLGADIGVYYYDNTFESFTPGNWTLFNTNLPNSRVTNLNIFYPTNKLRISTYGRGTWESPITIALPVELISFTGKNKGSENILFWRTATETNLDYYSVERSSDGRTYEAFGKVEPAQANSVAEQQYTYSDSNPWKGINYYRLKIMDIDGQYEYSRTVVIFVDDTKNAIGLFPNPTSDFIEVKGVNADNVTIHLINTIGRTVSTFALPDNNQIDVSRFPSGTYYAEILVKGERLAVKQFFKK